MSLTTACAGPEPLRVGMPAMREGLFRQCGAFRTEIASAEHVVRVAAHGNGSAVPHRDRQPAGGFAEGTRAVVNLSTFHIVSICCHMHVSSKFRVTTKYPRT